MGRAESVSGAYYWFKGDMWFASLGEFGWLGWGGLMPLRHFALAPRQVERMRSGR